MLVAVLPVGALTKARAGKELAEQAKKAFPAVSVIRTLSPTDFAFCREQADIGPAELKPLLQACKPTYLQLSANPPSSPHNRCDIGDWVPLDP